MLNFTRQILPAIFAGLRFSWCWLLLAQGSLPAQEVQTPAAMLQAGNAAYLAQNWQEAVRWLQQFLDTYGTDPALAEPVRKVQPLLALSYLRQGDWERAEAPGAAALEDPDTDPAVRAELRFFAGLGALRKGKQEEARTQLGAVFNDERVEESRRMEALVLGGTSYVLQEDWPGAIQFFSKYGKIIRASSPEAGGRADLLHLHALLKAGDWEGALSLAQEVAARLDQVRQVVTLSTLLIDLGSRFLEQDQPYQAIAVLRLVLAREELMELQRAKIEESKADLQYATESGNAVRHAQLAASLRDMEKDLQGIEAMPQFDSASRLRLAQAYSSLGRTRETSLILDQMVRQMPPDEIVESACVQLISGWMALQRWSRAARAADVYVDRLSALPFAHSLPGVLFARAQAYEGQYEYAQAAAAYQEVARRFSGDELAPQARFLEAYNVLQLEQYAEAGRLLDALLTDLPAGHEMWDHACFWRAMVDYFEQKWEPARARLEEYQKQVTAGRGTGDYGDDAVFRRGYAFFSEARYEPAIAELLRLEQEYPGSEWLPEALLTLGDSYAATGELDLALASYARIPVEAGGFHDEGWMKKGQVFKARKDLEGMQAAYLDFLKVRAQSPRIAEALHWLGWIAKQRGEVAEGRRIYWDALRRFGNDQARPGLEDMFLGLIALYPGDQKRELESQLEREGEVAETRGQTGYAARLGWARAQLLQRTQPLEAQTILAKLGASLEPEETAPRLLADCADALAANGDGKGAARLFEGLRKWYPRAPERDRAFAGLGFLALERGDGADALALFDRFEKTAVLPKSAPDEHGVALVEGEAGGKVALARASLLAANRREEALHVYSALQKSKAMPSRIRAQAFLDAAALHAGIGQARESLPYFEQVYVLFNRYPDLVAQAYWGRGQALEKLGRAELAREVYSELALREDLRNTPQAAEGRSRAVSLGGVVQPKLPDGGEFPPAPVKGKGES